MQGLTKFFTRRVLVGLVGLAVVTGCVNVNPPTDVGDTTVSSPTAPSGPTTPAGPTTPSDPTTPATSTPTAVAYNQDVKALFASDCVVCHGGNRADGNYRMTTYAQVMTAVRPGSVSSTLVRVTQSNGSMYRYWTGSATTRQNKAATVRSWIVDNNAQENR